MNPKQKIDLTIQIAEYLQSAYTFQQIDSILSGYGIDVRDEPYGNSKREYAERLLGACVVDTIRTMATDLNIVQQPSSVSGKELDRLWGNGLRLFVSHSAAYKAGSHQLAQELAEFGIKGFVAHDDIEPGSEWQTQLERALNSMECFVCVVTADYSGSRWCDQETGWALGRRIPIIPIKAGADPYGFVGRFQAVNGYKRSKRHVTLDLVKIISRRPELSASLRKHVEPGLSRFLARTSDQRDFIDLMESWLSMQPKPPKHRLEAIVTNWEAKTFYDRDINNQFIRYFDGFTEYRDFAARIDDLIPF